MGDVVHFERIYFPRSSTNLELERSIYLITEVRHTTCQIYVCISIGCRNCLPLCIPEVAAGQLTDCFVWIIAKIFLSHEVDDRA